MKRQKPLEVVFFESDAGNQPVKAFLTSRPKEDRKEIGADIYNVQKEFPVGLPLVRKVDIGLWEVRSTIPDGICRILFTVTNTKMVLLHGFVKKTQKIPPKELEIAINRLKEFNNLSTRIKK
ncbi:MAG: type II toxin-antitoxin system RelE/ParE family toxin [Treponema sp.]|nr:type II toxin-antitoxin system RelE/ParE family toxin [Treponema sp.]